ncbi:MAG: tetratricopeptide repeat protein [Flaviramulus sp.]|nr:tetratricopeptide repeat protein [Flaviramulus sp.]
MIRLMLLCFLIVLKTEAQNSVLKLADSLYLNGNYSKAIEHYKLHENQPDVFDNIAKAYMAIGNYEEALKNYEFSITSNPKDALSKYEYAKLLSRTKNYDEASKVFNELVYLDYKNPNYHYELGLVLEQLKDSTAINRFRSAFDLDKTHQKAIYKIAKYFLQKRKHEAVDSYTDKGLESYPNNLELISLKAQNYYWKQDYKEAVNWFERLLELGETSEFIYEKLSLCYYQLNNVEKALENRLFALKYNPNDASMRYVIGTYYLDLNDFKNAEKYINQALLLLDQPLDAEYMKLATVLNRQEKYIESISALNKAINENPSNELAYLHLAITKESYYADYDAKIKAYEDIKNKFPKSMILKFVDAQISKLKEEKFIKEGEKKD